MRTRLAPSRCGRDDIDGVRITAEGGRSRAASRPFGRGTRHEGCSRAAARSQSGASLVEVLISVMLVGTVVAALAVGMLTMVGATRSTAEEQRIQSALLSFTESLKASPYLPCGGSPSPTASAYVSSHASTPQRWTPPAGMTASIDDVEYWHDAGTYGDYRATCPGADGGRQRLTVTVRLDDGRRGSAEVVLADRLSGGGAP